MTDPTSPFGDPEVLCFGVPELRRYWACLLQDCIEKYAQEHPLYALFSSVLSTLSKITSAADLGASPTSTDGSILFSYPQCRVVDKEAVGDSEFASMSAYPDFGLMHLKTKRSANGETKVEQVRLLIEIKRLYRYDEEAERLWTDGTNLPWVLDRIVSSNFRQLLLQAYCTFSAYKQREVFIMFISGVYFTLLKFKRPEDFKPLPQSPDISNKKRKSEVEESDTGRPKCRAAKEIKNFQLTSVIPLECIQVVYRSAPVFDDIKARDLRLSVAFRQALRERLDDFNFQPCSLFDLCGAQYAPSDECLDATRNSISQWYSRMKAEGNLRTPNRQWQPYVESPFDNKEGLISPEFKGKASGVGSRESLQRKSKDLVNYLRSADRPGGDVGLNKGRFGSGNVDVDGSRQGVGSGSRTEDGGEGRRRPWEGKSRASDPVDSEI